MPEINTSPPRDGLVRALQPGIELRDAGDGQMPTLVSNFAVFNQFTEIDSWFEGRFMERIAPGAFKKTIRENREQIKPLFQHGADPQIGSKPLGAVTDLREDAAGAVGEVQLLDTSYVRELLPGLKANLYGSSFRFQVMREEIAEEPGVSDENPHGLPERTIKEIRLFEFGPVTFPAYQGTSAGLRSLTDELILARDPERLRKLLEQNASGVAFPVALGRTEPDQVQEPESQDAPPDHEDAPVDDGAASEHPADDAPLSEGEAAASTTSEVRDQKENEMPEEALKTKAEILDRQGVVKSRLEEIAKEHGAAVLPDEVEREFTDLAAEGKALQAQLAAFESREKLLVELGGNGDGPNAETEVSMQVRTNPSGSKLPDNLFSLDEYRMHARTPDEHRQLLRDGALKIVDEMKFRHERADDAEAKDRVEKLLAKDSRDGEIARRIITCGSPTYARAFGKTLMGQPLSSEEQRAMSLTDTAGGFAVPIALDPTVIPTSDGAINPLRQMARVETITSDVWKGVSSEGVVATRTTEAAQATDDAPTFASPEITPTRVHCWIPFSYEIGMDFQGLQAELARMLSDAKDVEEADQFINGNGDPEGVVAGLALTSHIVSGTVNGFGVEDLYRLKNALPPRFRGRASFLANDSFYSEIRQLDTSGGASLWTTLANDRPANLIGKPAFEASEMASTSVSGDDVLLYGDFSYYCIVDRVGMSIELAPQVFGANQRPTGQRGLYAFWRNSAEILSDNAFRLLTIGLTS